MIETKEQDFSACMGPNCNLKIPMGDLCYLINVTEMTADRMPYFPKIEESNTGDVMYSETLDNLENRTYPFRCFCSIQCLIAYFQKEQKR